MEFFTTAVSSLSTVVTAIGAGVGVWGVKIGRASCRERV